MTFLFAFLLCCAVCIGIAFYAASSAHLRGTEFSDTPLSGEERSRLLSFSLARLQKLEDLEGRPFATNRVAFRPEAQALGKRLFFDTGLSREKTLACSSCHAPESGFASARVVDDPSHGPRNPPTLLGVAWNEFFFWDGRKDSLWAQAIAPLIHPREHDLSFEDIAAHVRGTYEIDYRTVFGIEPTGDPRRIAANVAKAIAAYEMTLRPVPSPLDEFLTSLEKGRPRPSSFSSCAAQGARLFIGPGRCVNCHNGPLLTNHFFHNTGVPPAARNDNPLGFFVGSFLRDKDIFRCEGEFSDAPDACAHVAHRVKSGALGGAFKTPTLRGLTRTAPYMHNGVYATIEEVVAHYDRAPPSSNGESELFPLALDEASKRVLACFLRAL